MALIGTRLGASPRLWLSIRTLNTLVAYALLSTAPSRLHTRWQKLRSAQLQHKHHGKGSPVAVSAANKMRGAVVTSTHQQRLQELHDRNSKVPRKKVAVIFLLRQRETQLTTQHCSPLLLTNGEQDVCSACLQCTAATAFDEYSSRTLSAWNHETVATRQSWSPQLPAE